jgi:flagellin-like protein
MKGVSAIIATILMLVITIGLAGTAYVYISGMLTGKTATTISIIDYSCAAGTNVNVINLVISNDGTADIPGAANGVLKIYVDNVDHTSDFGSFNIAGTWLNTEKGITAHTTKPILNNDAAAAYNPVAGAHTVLVSTPSNAQRITVTCP